LIQIPHLFWILLPLFSLSLTKCPPICHGNRQQLSASGQASATSIQKLNFFLHTLHAAICMISNCSFLDALFVGCQMRFSHLFYNFVEETNLNAQQMANEQVHCQGELLNCCCCCGVKEAGENV